MTTQHTTQHDKLICQRKLALVVSSAKPSISVEIWENTLSLSEKSWYMRVLNKKPVQFLNAWAAKGMREAVFCSHNCTMSLTAVLGIILSNMNPSPASPICSVPHKYRYTEIFKTVGGSYHYLKTRGQENLTRTSINLILMILGKATRWEKAPWPKIKPRLILSKRLSSKSSNTLFTMKSELIFFLLYSNQACVKGKGGNRTGFKIIW